MTLFSMSNTEPLDSETTSMTHFKLLEHSWDSPTCYGHCQHNTEPLDSETTPIMTNFKLLEHSWDSPTCHGHCQHNTEPLDSETTPIMTNFKLLEHSWDSPTCQSESPSISLHDEQHYSLFTTDKHGMESPTDSETTPKSAIFKLL